MVRTLTDYREVVGDSVLSSIYRSARKLYGRNIVHINSAYQGGGVAEILSSLAPLMNDIGIDAGWRILHGNPDFFNVTKKFHNALQGQKIEFSDMKERVYVETNENFSIYTHLDHDCVIIHDPQPLPQIAFHKKQQPWIWRCHVDLSNPYEVLWDFLKGFIIQYDHVIISNEQYRSGNLPVEQRVIPPAIDPLAPKNMELSRRDIEKTLSKFGVPTDKPIVTQISRFDKWKDPLGVLDVYLKVKKEFDCRLVLCGSMAMDDPEGVEIYEKVHDRAKEHIKADDVILLTTENNILVNALQRSSAVIVQKSLREGFGLTVTEALWKGKPVVASKVGGIPLQVSDGEGGFLIDPLEKNGFVEKILYLLRNPKIADDIGRKGRETVKQKFLITRLLKDYIDLLIEVLSV